MGDNSQGVVNRVKVEVHAYSGYKANEKPRSFVLNERRYQVEEVCDQWYGPDSSYFKVRADDQNLYILQYKPALDEWSLESFRTGAG